MGCTSLTGLLILPEKLSIIGKYSFAGCTGFSSTLTIPSSVIEIKTCAFFGCIGFEEIIFSHDDRNDFIHIEIYAFSKLHNKCYRNIPESIYDSFEINDPQIYSSDNFDGKIVRSSFNLNLNCEIFYTIDNILVSIVSIISSGSLIIIFGFATQIISGFLNNVHKMKHLFNDIIQQEIESIKHLFNDIIQQEIESIIINDDKPNNNVTILITNPHLNQEELCKNVVNSINSYLNEESKSTSFTITRWQANKALHNIVESKLENMFDKHKQYIYLQSFNDITFHENFHRMKQIFSSISCCSCCCCSNCKCKTKESDSDDIIAMETLI